MAFRLIHITKLLLCTASLLSCLSAHSQTPVFAEGFEALDSAVSRVNGISGKALDLGPRAKKRNVLLINNPVHKEDTAFTVMVWVKEDAAAQEAYDILSCMTKKDSTFEGWSIKSTVSGSWSFNVRSAKTYYNYTTTAPRQTIRDGQWHLLAVSYADNQLRFYYDGKLMALYRADGIRGFYGAEKLVIGGSMDSEHYFEHMPYESFWDTFDGQIDDISLFDQALPEKNIADYYEEKTGEVLTVPFKNMPSVFKITSFNIFHGGNEFGKEAGKGRLIDILRGTNSDAVLLVETYGSGPQIADALGYYLYLISSNLSILSRYPIVKTYRLTESFKSGGAQIAMPNGKKVNLFCVWLDWQPAFFMYGFQNNKGWTLEQYMKEENKTRGTDIRVILNDIQPYLNQRDSIPVIVGGDFNSGSHLDWTERAKSIHKGYVVPWPASIAMAGAGFKDSYRELFPDPLKYPGISFSDHYKLWINTRLDYIYYQGKGIKAIQSEIIGKDPVLFPSDHAAASTLFNLK